MFTPYFDFNGNGKEALEFYKEAFNGEVVRMLQYKDMPVDPKFPELDHQREWLLNGELNINGHQLLMSDTDNYQQGRQVKINITETPENLKKIWAVLSVGATSVFPLNKTFFSPLHGALTDKFGIIWLFTAPADA